MPHSWPGALRAGLGFAALLTLGACTEYLIADRAIDFNIALESANNRQILLNAVRASKRHPMIFSEPTIVRAKDPVTGGATLTLPFGGGTNERFALSPSVSLGSGISLEYKPLNSQEFFRGITTTVKMKTVDYYLDQGWPAEMILLMLVREIKLDKTDEEVHPIDSAFDAICGTINQCNSAKRNQFKNRSVCPISVTMTDTSGKSFVNAPGKGKNDHCGFLEFQNLIRKLIALNIRIAFNPSASTSKLEKRIVTNITDEKTGRKKRVVRDECVIKEGGGLQFKFDIEGDKHITLSEVQKVSEDRNVCGVSESGNDGEQDAKNTENGKILLRSPEAMIFYMGELIEAQAGDKMPYTPTVKSRPIENNPEGEEPLLKVSDRPGGNAIISVDYEGEPCSIPREGKGRSMHVLSLVNQILALNRKSEDLPATPSVVLSGQ